MTSVVQAVVEILFLCSLQNASQFCCMSGWVYILVRLYSYVYLVEDVLLRVQTATLYICFVKDMKFSATVLKRFLDIYEKCLLHVSLIGRE